MRHQGRGGGSGGAMGGGSDPPMQGSSDGGGRRTRGKGGKRRKAGECGTRRVGPYAAAPNTDNAGCGGNQRRQASASGQRGKASASGSEQWWHKRARRRGSGGGAGGSNGSGSGVHSVISSNSVSFIGVTSLIPKTSIPCSQARRKQYEGPAMLIDFFMHPQLGSAEFATTPCAWVPVAVPEHDFAHCTPATGLNPDGSGAPSFT